MAQSLNKILLHLVFSTKDRCLLIDDPWREDLHRYITGILRDCGGTLFAVNSLRDHVHVLYGQSRTVAVAEVVQAIKGSSSRWINSTASPQTNFHWQRGYGVFSVGASEKRRIINYIADQREHHRSRSFQDEYRQLLKDYEISFDERYVWE
jgi:REP element-mobilizing transposase RayT